MEQDAIEFLEYLTLTKGLMNKSIKDYLDYYKLFDLSKVSSQEYCDKFIQDHRNNSVVRGMLLNLLQFRGMHKIIDLPPRKTGSPKIRIAREISKKEIDMLKDYLYSKSFKKGLIFELMYQGALRKVEVPTIKINSFRWARWMADMDQPCHLIVLGKRDKERVVLINPETAEKILNYYRKKLMFIELDDYERFANSPVLLFGNMKEHETYNLIKRSSIKCLGRDIRPHELRHCRATELEKMGVAIKDIKVYLGHSNLSTTEIYLHRNETESIENIQNIINQQGVSS